MNVHIIVDDLRGHQIAGLLQRHLNHMYQITPAGSVYALDMDGLRAADITFWTAWVDEDLVGCIALKDHGDGLGEIKSMHTAVEHRGRGIARQLVEHLIEAAKQNGLTRLSLETGKTEHFEPAQALYRSFGFAECGPFADYGPDPHSFFMTRDL